ncbi:RNA polymerase sigma factor [Puia dinghuensis]|nr:sigma-70 family RNA polymerase sigma factor [Puia dinghuensis]
MLEKFRQGDEETFRKIFEQHSKSLTWFVDEIVKNEQEAKDIMGSAMVKLWQNREKMVTTDHIRRWLYYIARNEAYDFLKKQNAAAKYVNEQTYLHSKIEQQAELDGDKGIWMDERSQLLKKKIDSLANRQQTIIKLYFFEQKTTAEIAAQLKIENQSVLNHKTKALANLREMLPFDITDLIPLALPVAWLIWLLEGL